MKRLFTISLLFSSLLHFSQGWITQNTGFTTANRGIKAIKIVDQNIIWALAYDASGSAANIQELTVTTNGGTSWAPRTINVEDTSLQIVNISPVNASTAWVAAIVENNGGGKIYKTIDGGLNWTRQNSTGYTNPTASWLNGVHFFNENDGVSFGDPLGNDPETYITSNGGADWTQILDASIPNALSAEYGYTEAFTTFGNTLWYVTNKGKIYKTSDKGVTWTKWDSPISDFGGTNTYGTLHFSDLNNGIIVGTNDNGDTFQLYKTTNGGETWDAGTPYDGPHKRYTTVIPNTTSIVETSDNQDFSFTYGSAYSYNNGGSWINIDNTQRGIPAFYNPTTGWCGGFNTNSTTGGIYKYSGPALGRNSVDFTNSFSFYPNPTKDILSITSETETLKEIAIYNLIGKQVFHSEYNENSYQKEINLTHLPAGIYVAKAITTEDKHQIFKLVKE